MNKEKIRAVLFDLDDTLQDRAGAFAGYCGYFLSRYFPMLAPEEHEKRKWQMEQTVNGGYIDREVYFSALIADWGWRNAPDPRVLSEEYDLVFGHYVKPFPESRQVLLELKRRGYLTGIITNGPSCLQNTKLDASGLRPYVDLAIVSGDVKVRKPDPEIFRIAARRLGVSTERCVYVGDHPVNDVEGAQGAGMQAVWMQYGTFRNQAVADVPVIRRVGELLELV